MEQKLFVKQITVEKNRELPLVPSIYEDKQWRELC